MSTSAASLSGAAGRYASAMFELAQESGALDAVESEFQALKTLLAENDDLASVIGSPAFSREEQTAVIGAIQDKLSQSALTRNFVGLMASKGRLAVLPDAMDGFASLLADHRGQETAYVTTAKKLTDAQSAALVKNLNETFGKDIRIEETVDPSLLGGLIVKVGSKMVDGSLKSKLERLELTMKAN